MFILVYQAPGLALPYGDLSSEDRTWLVERIAKQQRDEEAAVKKVRSGKRSR